MRRRTIVRERREKEIRDGTLSIKPGRPDPGRTLGTGHGLREPGLEINGAGDRDEQRGQCVGPGPDGLGEGQGQVRQEQDEQED